MSSCELLILESQASTDMYSGPLVFARDQARKLLELADPIKEIVDAQDGKLAVFFGFMKPPQSPKAQPLALIFYDGPAEKAKDIIKPLYDLGPVAEMTHVVPYAQITAPNSLVDGPPTHQRFATSNFQVFFPIDVDMWLNLVNDLDAFMSKYGEAVAPSKIVMEIRSYAKSSSIPVSAMAYALRRPAIMGAIEAQYDASVSDVVMRSEIKVISDKARDIIRKKGLYLEGTATFNANISTGEEKITDMFGENLPKLRELKKKYDPKFVFNKWYPIAPAA
jgi:FAD/FMN-containing dehydrogenase